MNNSTQALIRTRASTRYYKPDNTLSDAQIRDLIDLATRAPSAYHLQN